MLVSATVIASISKQYLFKYKWLSFFGYIKFGWISGLYQTTLEPSSNSVVIFFIVKNETPVSFGDWNFLIYHWKSNIY